MSSPMMGFASGLTRWWVQLYTKGVSSELRDARQAEIESDLWEHGAGNGADGVDLGTTALQVVGRLMFGMPADLSWRFEQRRPQRALTEAIPTKGRGVDSRPLHKAWLAMTLLLAGAYVALGASIGLGATTGHVAFAIIFATLGAVMLTGICVSKWAPWLGASLLTVGALTAAVLLFYLFIIVWPMTAFVVVFGIRRANRFARERTALGGGRMAAIMDVVGAVIVGFPLLVLTPLLAFLGAGFGIMLIPLWAILALALAGRWLVTRRKAAAAVA